jgi:Flp pilus assembly protein TadG
MSLPSHLFRPRTPDGARERRRDEGQALVLLVLVAGVMLLAAALVTDVSWFWVNQQRMQRAADAAALAGAVYLPGDVPGAYAAARAEAAKNGFTDGAGGVTVTPHQDSRNRRRLSVAIGGRVNTFFARAGCVIAPTCLDHVPVSVAGNAEYVLPVPMGSPENYYGVGYYVGAERVTNTVTNSGQTAWLAEGAVVAGGKWTNPTNARSADSVYTTVVANANNDQQWTTFGLRGTGAVPSDATLVVDGIEVELFHVSLTGSGTSTSCKVTVDMSWNGGANWTSTAQTGALGTNKNDTQTVGSSSSMSAWGNHSWVSADFTDANFRVRLLWPAGNASCAASRGVQLDQLLVRVTYRTFTTTYSWNYKPMSVTSPTGGVLAPQNFWGAMQSQGAPSIQGDAYMTNYDVRTSVLNSVSNTDPDARYDPVSFYDYAVSVPAGATNGQVWVFDPGFCDVSTAYGTGENWTVGGANGNSTRQPVSAFFDLFDTRSTLWDESDDTLVASSGNTFRRLSLSDAVFNQTFASDCSGLAWHNGWWRLASGLSGGSRGSVYRLHTYSTDTSAPNDQNDTTALNAFAIWATATGGTPRVYGIGAMEAYVRLPGGTSSEFYLAQVEALHAGRSLVIDLWDPGDTGNLAASLQILQPTATSYTPATFSYTARKGSTASAASSCDSRSGTNVTSVTTNTGGTSLYNGCWLTLIVPLATTYTAPHPASDTTTSDGGWWKIRYNMSGSTSDYATDLTTWEVKVPGAPVHLTP